MQFYLAARYGRREELVAYSQQIEACRHKVEARWLSGSHETAELDSKAKTVAAIEDLYDINQADCFIAFTEKDGTAPNASRGGRHVELGYAIAKGGKLILLVGPRENVFCHLPEITAFETWEECLKYIQDLPVF